MSIKKENPDYHRNWELLQETGFDENDRMTYRVLARIGQTDVNQPWFYGDILERTPAFEEVADRIPNEESIIEEDFAIREVGVVTYGDVLFCIEGDDIVWRCC